MDEKLEREKLTLADAIDLVVGGNIDRLEGRVTDDIGCERAVKIYWDEKKDKYIAEIDGG